MRSSTFVRGKSLFDRRGLRNYLKRISVTFILLFAPLATVFAQTTTAVSGFVRDTNGAAVAGARVSIADLTPVVTDANGYFRVDNISGSSHKVVVSAKGFQSYSGEWNASHLEVTLTPAPINEQITVTRKDSTLGSTPQSVAVVGETQLRSSSAATVDDKLRQVPGFTLFRRSGSRNANPTSQGVSLRGTGGSGASRAAVLHDGFPINDPFGGWVYWGRIPTVSIDSVEVLRGAAGEISGNAAIGGVVDINSISSERTLFDLDLSYGSQNTSLASTFIAVVRGRLRSSLAGEFFRTDGFITVANAQRGAVDTASGVMRSTLLPFVEYKWSEPDRAFGRVEYFEERRSNGTRLQTNDTKIYSIRAGADLVGPAGAVALRGWLQSEIYHQSFSSISTDRNTEVLTRLQTVPSRSAGGSFQWSRSITDKINFYTGGEFRLVRGSSDEIAYTAGRPVSFVNAGGREATVGFYVGGAYLPTQKIILSAGLRFDRWREYSGYSDSRPLLGLTVSRNSFTNRAKSALSPRLSALFRVNELLSLTGSVSTGFRQPTLNELYRSFRVGNVLTLANEQLTAEKALTIETGILVTAFSDRIYLRSVGFCTRINDPVSNVTLTITPSVITRQRQNLGSTRSRGIETDSQILVRHDLSIAAGYLFVDSYVRRFPADAALEGLRVPQVPKHQFSFSARYSNPAIATVNLQYRASSYQFDDDQNLFRLDGFAVVDAYVERRVSSNFSIYVAAENIFGSTVEAGRTPVLTLSNPRTIRVGLRLNIGRR
jgi:outer membrane receptor protein involved in Fe transport